MAKESKKIHEKLSMIQTSLKVHKGQMNSFGGYKYRSAEDILEALKPYLKQHELVLTISEKTQELGGYLFVDTTAELMDADGDSRFSHAQAGINPERKGMDIAQSFGASSSYAKKYALGNLFLLDDTKDADADTNPNTVSKPAKATKKKMTEKILQLMEASIEGGKSDVVRSRMKDYTMTKKQQDRLNEKLS